MTLRCPRGLLAAALVLATALSGAPAPVALAPVAPAPVAVAQDAVSFEPGTYAVDGVHSTAWFGVRHLGVANFYGRFNGISGEFVLADAAAECSVSVTVDPASVDTANKSRDDHIRSAEFLDVENHAVMSFESSAVEAGEEAGTYRVTGTLDLHGVEREVTVDARLIGAGETAFGDVRAGLEATFTVRRSEYGMNAMLDKLGDEVRFTLSLEGRHAD